MSHLSSHLFNYIEEWAPIELAASWDNVGLQIGSAQSEVHRVLLALDADHVAAAAIGDTDYDLVITHHPLLFSPLRQLNLDRAEDRVIKTFLETNTHLYTAHTNLDRAEGGVNDCLIQAYGLDPSLGQPFNDGFGKWFSVTDLSSEGLLDNMPAIVKGAPLPESIQRIGFCAGSGNGLVTDVIASQLDVFVTGECSYHTSLSCEMNGVSVLCLGHKESEVVVLPELQRRLLHRFPDLSIDILS